MGTRNHIVQFISIVTCAIWVVSLAVIVDPEPAGFHTELDTQTTLIAGSVSDIENYEETSSDTETVASLASDGSFGTDSAVDPPSSLRSLRRKGIVPLPTGVSGRIVRTILRL